MSEPHGEGQAPKPFADATCSAFLRVNYGINQRLQGRHFSHRNGKMCIKGNWEDDATHEKIKAIIRRRHPGWNITGWCMANTPNPR